MSRALLGLLALGAVLGVLGYHQAALRERSAALAHRSALEAEQARDNAVSARPAPVAPDAASPASEAAAERPAPETIPSEPEPTSDGAGAEEAPDPAPVDSGAFGAWLDERVRGGTKAELAEVLSGWRTGARPRAHDLLVDEAVARLDAPARAELDKAAGRLLLSAPTAPEQRRGLAALLAHSGSELATGYLLEAADQLDAPDLAEDARAAIATLAAPAALEPLAARAEEPLGPELRDALLAALRNMTTPKARELEAKLSSR